MAIRTEMEQSEIINRLRSVLARTRGALDFYEKLRESDCEYAF